MNVEKKRGYPLEGEGAMSSSQLHVFAEVVYNIRT